MLQSHWTWEIIGLRGSYYPLTFNGHQTFYPSLLPLCYSLLTSKYAKNLAILAISAPELLAASKFSSLRLGSRDLESKSQLRRSLLYLIRPLFARSWDRLIFKPTFSAMNFRLSNFLQGSDTRDSEVLIMNPDKFCPLLLTLLNCLLLQYYIVTIIPFYMALTLFCIMKTTFLFTTHTVQMRIILMPS